jgi:hypothetical protein
MQKQIQHAPVVLLVYAFHELEAHISKKPA